MEPPLSKTCDQPCGCSGSATRSGSERSSGSSSAAACKNIRYMSLSSAYVASPTMACWWCEQWRRSWCRRPVCGKSQRSEASRPACWPTRSTPRAPTTTSVCAAFPPPEIRCLKRRPFSIILSSHCVASHEGWPKTSAQYTFRARRSRKHLDTSAAARCDLAAMSTPDVAKSRLSAVRARCTSE